MIGACCSCGDLYDFPSEEAANEPHRLCQACWHAEADYVGTKGSTPSLEAVFRHPKEFIEGMSEMRRTARRRADGSIEVTPWEDVP